MSHIQHSQLHKYIHITEATQIAQSPQPPPRNTTVPRAEPQNHQIRQFKEGEYYGAHDDDVGGPDDVGVEHDIYQGEEVQS